jgi:isoleucyl-tRNA synthetase
MPVKDPETEKAIIISLKKRGLLLRQQKFDHEYPHCWRCGTPVLYYARTAWFVAMSKLRAQMQKRNNTVNWIPGHIKQGRFGEWLKDAKDWNFSRERYWGTPLPVWVCDTCKRHEVIGSIDDLGNRMGGPQNQYWVMRHGEAESNVQHLLDSSHGEYDLTPKGEHDVERAARSLKDQGIDLVIASDYLRTQETAHMVAKTLGVPVVSYDKRLREFNFGSLSGRSVKELKPYLPTSSERMATRVPHGESIHDLRTRVWHLLDELEHEYKGRRILLVSHDYPTWMLQTIAEGWSDEKSVEELGSDGANFLKTGDARRLFFRAMPRNDRGELDLHRPFVDAPSFPCHAGTLVAAGRTHMKEKCEGMMRRVSEVIDVWYDSGAMPLAQQHYPFEHKKEIDDRMEYPADYIAEGVDQTRGWFYTLLAVATLLGLEAPYKNVIVNNFINDKDGQKMSKSKGNVLDPWELIKKHGIDAVRWYFYAASEPGDPKNFDEADITKMFRKMHLIFYNTLSFYSLYGKPGAGRGSSSGRVKQTLLDKWILTRMHATVEEVTHALDIYQIRSATTAIDSFLDDLSRWYIRVSRRRFQRPESASDHAVASRTLLEVLQTTTKLIAPFMPFFAEACYHRLRATTDPISVHLADWPRAVLKGLNAADKKLLADMALIRETGAQALAKRAEVGIKVRQPLASLTVKNKAVVKHAELVEILKAEVNVKEVFAKSALAEPLTLDITMTPELLEEGTLREFLRSVQELRQKADLNPQDTVQIYVTAPAAFMTFLMKYEKQIKKDVRAKGVQQKRVAHADAEADLVFDRQKVWLGVKKV